MLWLISVGGSCALAVASSLSGSSIDTQGLRHEFRTAEPIAQLKVNQAVLSIQGAHYREALVQLKGIFKDSKITPEQRHAVRELISRIERTLSRNGQGVATPAPSSERNRSEWVAN